MTKREIVIATIKHRKTGKVPYGKNTLYKRKHRLLYFSFNIWIPF